MSSIEQTEDDWQQLLLRPRLLRDAEKISAFHADKVVMITGAGGSIGSALALEVMQLRPRLLLLLEASEQSLYRLDVRMQAANSSAPIVSLLGSVTDTRLLDEIFREHQPDLVYHAAAHKHVPLMEAHPLAAISNNALGTHRLARTAANHDVRQVLMISTDKAADPISIMGASKRIAESALAISNSDRTRMHSLRMGNVLGSEGSVAPRFLQQIEQGGPVTVAHRDAERFFFTLRDAISLVFEAATHGDGQQTLVPETGASIRLVELAKYMIGKHSSATGPEVSMLFTGLRPGDKMTERFVASDECLGENISVHLSRVHSNLPSKEMFDSAIDDLEDAVRARNLGATLMVVQKLVPHYKPGAHLAHPRALSVVGLHV